METVQNFKKMCKNLPILDLPNEEDDLILETDASYEHWNAVLKIKEGEQLCKYCSENFDKAKCNGKGNFCSYKGNRKVFNLFSPQNLFSFELIAKE